MENKLLKGAIYSFILGVLLGLILFPDSQIINRSDGSSETHIAPIRDYIFTILRFAIKIMFGTVILQFILHKLNQEKTVATNYFKGFIKSFLIVFIAIILISSIVIWLS